MISSKTIEYIVRIAEEVWVFIVNYFCFQRRGSNALQLRWNVLPGWIWNANPQHHFTLLQQARNEWEHHNLLVVPQCPGRKTDPPRDPRHPHYTFRDSEDLRWPIRFHQDSVRVPLRGGEATRVRIHGRWYACQPWGSSDVRPKWAWFHLNGFCFR